jgi:putative spermidine/putrescine transport system permease protein
MRTARSPMVTWLALAGVPFILFLVLYAGPVLQLFRLSLSRFDPSVGVIPDFQLGYYIQFLTDGYYLGILERTIAISLVTTAACAVLAYPIAYYLISAHGWRMTTLLVVLLLPLVTSSVAISYGWLILLGPQGLVNQALIGLGVTAVPLKLMYSEAGIIIGLTHVLLVFMVLSVASSLRGVDANMVKAARSLGAGPWTAFRKIVFPQTVPGLRTGALLVFSLSMSAYATPVLIGGLRIKVLSYLIFQQSSALLNWPFASAMAVILLAGTAGVLGLVSAYGQWSRMRSHRRFVATVTEDRS